ncbi:hypothetical protein ACHAQH_008817 [Verticillium albo-atrum]
MAYRPEGVKAQPGVFGAAGGPIVVENGGLVKEFKFLQCIVFKSAEDAKAFEASAWVQEQKALYQDAPGEEVVSGDFEVPEFGDNSSVTPFTQFVTLILDDENKSKLDDVTKAWMDVAQALGKETFGGTITGDGPTVSLGMISWDTLTDAENAFKNSAATAAWAKYQSFGKLEECFVELEWTD